MEIVLGINKANVYHEVDKSTSYAGKNSSGENSSYEKIRATDEQREVLEQYWSEGCSTLTDLFKHFIKEVADCSQGHGVDLGKNYRVVLSMPGNYDTNLNESISSDMMRFMVEYISGRWTSMSDDKLSQKFMSNAKDLLGSIKRKIYYRKKPTRPKN